MQSSALKKQEHFAVTEKVSAKATRRTLNIVASAENPAKALYVEVDNSVSVDYEEFLGQYGITSEFA